MNPLHIGFDASGKRILLTPEDRKTHMHVIGSSGSGKSKFLEWLMRGDLQNRQGFCLIDPEGTLYEEVVNYSAHHVLNREIIFLNLSEPDSVIGFNPFRKGSQGDTSVQVDNRISATVHAWNVANTDNTPTLERVLRLIYTAMLEQNLGLPEVEHLIDFEAKEIRSHLIENLQSGLIQKEWRELQQYRLTDWRNEVLSTKNKLFRLLTSPTLKRFMGLPERTLDLKQVMDEGKVLLVNLAPSIHLSMENARVFGALLVNEFFEKALLRKKDDSGNDPNPYYLYIDEFQDFVSIDLTKMLDRVRKRGLFFVLAHQRFGQLDQDRNIIDAVLTNCKIRAVFGGLSAQSARLIAEEMFIGDLDPLKIKVALYQTKFWPEYRRDTVYSKSTSHSSGVSSGASLGAGQGSNLSSGQFFQGANWFGAASPSATSSASSESSFSFSGSGESSSESDGETTGTADIPMFFPVPFQELSAIQFFTFDEQLTQLTAALKEQFERHCFIKIRQRPTQPMLVPFVESLYTTQRNIDRYKERLLIKQNALTPAQIDSLIKERERALFKAATSEPIDAKPVRASPTTKVKRAKKSARETLFDTMIKPS